MTCLSCLLNPSEPGDDAEICCGVPISLAAVMRVQIQQDLGSKLIGSENFCNDDGEVVGYGITCWSPEDCTMSIAYIDSSGNFVSLTKPAQWEACPCENCTYTSAEMCVIEDDSRVVVGKMWIVQTKNSNRLIGYYTDQPQILIDPFVLGPTQSAVDCSPTEICEPSSDVQLNTSCAGGEVADTDIIASTDAEVIDDPSADVLCQSNTGLWSRNAEPNTAPFPVNESFRNGTTTDPNWTFFNDAHLTSGVEDPVGQGWLRINPDQTFRTGTAVIDTAFPSTEDVTFEFTYATYSNVGTPGVFPNGIASGMSVFLLDGSLPVPITYPLGGALSYSSNHISNEPSVAGGYVGVGLDENGNYSNSHPTQGVGQDAPPGNTARAPGENHVAIRGNTDGVDIHGPGAGTFITNGSVAANANGNKLGTQFRTNPVRVRGSFINEGGRILASIELDFNDNNGFQSIINRFDVTPVAGFPPATFKLGFGSSTGNVPGAHEIRDLIISRSAKQYWRGLNYQAANVPACATDFTFRISGESEITSDSQAAAGGNNEPEHKVLIVNTSTNTILESYEIISSPSQVGQKFPFTLITTPQPISEIGNIRVYVGAETLDNVGSYGSKWSKFNASYTAVGCPTEKIRTIAVSAPCPIPIEIVDAITINKGDTVINGLDALAISVEEICADGQPAFRRQTRDKDDNVVVTFISDNGAIITPSNWVAGRCDVSVIHWHECLQYTINPGDVPIRFTRVYHKNIVNNTINVQDHITTTGQQFILPPGAIVTDCQADRCEEYIGEFCTFTLPNVNGRAYGLRDCETGDVTYFDIITNVEINTNNTAIVDCTSVDIESNVFCDSNNQFIRTVIFDKNTGAVVNVVNSELDMVTPYTPVGNVALCETFSWEECFEYETSSDVRQVQTDWVANSPNSITAQFTDGNTGTVRNMTITSPNPINVFNAGNSYSPVHGMQFNPPQNVYNVLQTISLDVPYLGKLAIGAQHFNDDQEFIGFFSWNNTPDIIPAPWAYRPTGVAAGYYDSNEGGQPTSSPYAEFLWNFANLGTSATLRTARTNNGLGNSTTFFLFNSIRVKIRRIFHKNLITNVITTQDHDFYTNETITVPNGAVLVPCSESSRCIVPEYIGETCIGDGITNENLFSSYRGVAFDPGSSNLVFVAPYGSNSVNSTGDTNNAISANYLGPFSHFGFTMIDDGANLILRLFTTETGEITLDNFTPAITTLTNVGSTATHTKVVSGITVTLRSISTNFWRRTNFTSIPWGLQTLAGVNRFILTFSQPVTNLSLRFWGGSKSPNEHILTYGYNQFAEPTDKKAYMLRDCVTGNVRYFDKITNQQYLGAFTIIECDEQTFDTERIVLCDNNGPFLRHIVYSAVTGNVTSVFNTLMNGTTTYVPVGTVRDCFNRIYTWEQCLEYGPVGNKTKFKRIFHKDIGTGTITFQNHHYSTGAVITPGTPITSCNYNTTCQQPEYIGEICYETNVPGEQKAGYAVRNCEDGAITYFDRLTNAAIAANDVVQCYSPNTPEPVQARYTTLSGVGVWNAPTGGDFVSATITVIRTGNFATPVQFVDSTGSSRPLYQGQTISFNSNKDNQSDIFDNAGNVRVIASDANDIVAINWLEL